MSWWQVIQSARMEALMQHCQAAGFSKEVSRLMAAPRRPSMNDDRWLRFAHWAAGQGNELLGPPAAQIASFYTPGQSLQTIKGYRSCLASVLSCTGNAIYDMITSVELQRPRMTPVLLQVGPRHCARGLKQASL